MMAVLTGATRPAPRTCSSTTRKIRQVFLRQLGASRAAPPSESWGGGVEPDAQARRVGAEASGGAARGRVVARRTAGAPGGVRGTVGGGPRAERRRSQWACGDRSCRGSRYLLSGFGRFSSHLRTHGTGARRFLAQFYGCTSHWERGATVCTNGLVADMATIDAEVLARRRSRSVGGEVVGGHGGCGVSSGPERAAAACEGVGVARSSRSWPQQPAPSTQAPPRR